MEKYTINKLAKLAGVSVRTLQHYDQIGLLTPQRGETNKYRQYSEQNALTLQEIMFFRELEFPLSDIAKIISSPSYNRNEVLADHKKLLQIKKRKLTKLIKIIDQNMTSSNTKNSFKAFSEDQINQYKDEAKKRWGNTKSYKQSQERTKNWTKEDYAKIAEQGRVLNQELAKAMDLPISHSTVFELIKKHHSGIEVFYDCSPEMYKSLGQMYVDDPRFAKHYDQVKPGLAKFIKDAIHFHADNLK